MKMSIPIKPGFPLAKLKADPRGVAMSLGKKDALALAKYLDLQYFEHNKQLVPDEVYDILKEVIAERWPTLKYLKETGHRVTTKASRHKKVKLPSPMPSLSKLKPDSKDLPKFIERGPFVVGDKMDGQAIAVEYVGGLPTRAYTRGDGEIGRDISIHIPYMNIPKRVKRDKTVRCEFVIKNKTFHSKHHKNVGGEYEAPRNMGGGVINSPTASPAFADFDVIALEIIHGDGAGQKLSSQYAKLKSDGFTVVPHKTYSKLTTDLLAKLHDQRKAKSKYDIDGIVVVQDKPYKLTKNFPSHAKAFKINSLANSLVVPVTKVEWRKTRLGKIHPRIHVDPVVLGGVKVQHFTGHNYFYIQNGFKYQDRKKKLPVRPINVGSMIRVIRSGDVIPYIMEVVKPARRASQPDIPFKLDSNGVHAMATKVKGEVDTDTKKKKLIHFFSAMKIEGIKTGVMEKLYDAGFTSIKKIINATAHDFMRVEGIQEKGATKLVANIQSGLKELTFPQLAYASGVFGGKLGTTKLQAVIDHYPNILDMASMPKQQLASRLREVPGISNMADEIAAKLPRFVKFLEAHRLSIVVKKQEKKSDRLSGVKVLFTSVRDEDLLKEILSNGGAKASSVKSATHLITKPGASNNKTAQAQEMGIPVMTIDQFRKKFGV